MGKGGMYAAERNRVDVYLSDRDESARLLGAGKVVASGIFEKIGVHIDWRTGEPSATRGGDGDETLPKAFAIRTLEKAPESATPGALASARLVGAAGARIAIYKDRVLRFLDNHGNLAGAGAGYVLAHELAHAMQGVGRHSESGILKAQWSNSDFQEMIFHKLAFTDFDVDLIHRGLAPRLANAPAPAVSNQAER
jgi:hypothetical protein